MSSSSGTKVTSDPERFTNPVNEGAGTVTSDSLAGESLQSGGSFGSTTGAAASAQPSSSTTTNTTDTSNATVLDAAPDAEARQAKETWSETAQLNAGRDITDKNAVFGGRGAGSGTSDASGISSTNAASGVGERLAASQGEGLMQPKGGNLTEGGFQGTEPNASFGSEIGTKKDPGRAALDGFQKTQSQQAGDAGGRKDEKLSNDGQYDVLRDASA
ncbi:hypothetical protein B9Z65_5676 [Elsinoe australis]|uniref:Uncharacterized protein n=1 Tax=Elsinoe australis TaxID=40998 RepID=A0A2P7YIR6_9PEZI|nr:hypothetical protein B9Z65_5676 [Elsinoe australis]